LNINHMEQLTFDAKILREAATPPISGSEMARRMKIHRVYLLNMERGRCPWLPQRKADFLRALSEWEVNPVKTPRKQRSDIGRKRRKRRRKKRVEAVALPHSHHEITGIG
jgi:hypothetical protein